MGSVSVPRGRNQRKQIAAMPTVVKNAWQFGSNGRIWQCRCKRYYLPAGKDNYPMMAPVHQFVMDAGCGVVDPTWKMAYLTDPGCKRCSNSSRVSSLPGVPLLGRGMGALLRLLDFTSGSLASSSSSGLSSSSSASSRICLSCPYMRQSAGYQICPVYEHPNAHVLLVFANCSAPALGNQTQVRKPYACGHYNPCCFETLWLRCIDNLCTCCAFWAA